MFPRATALLLPLAACTTVPAKQEPERRALGADRKCEAAALQEHLGHKATAESGAILLKLSGAQALRWGAPGSAWTMDYRPDRLNVRYDYDMTITSITCG